MNFKGLLKPTAGKIAIFLLLTFITFLAILLIFHPETVRFWPLLFILIPVYITSALLHWPLRAHPLLLRIVQGVVFVPVGIVTLVAVISQFAPDKPPQDFLITQNFVDLRQFD